ncbi:MAG: proline racemase family protein [Bryobacteraceae bacterium]
MRNRSERKTGLSLCLGDSIEEQVWRQESLIGSLFEGSVTIRNGNFFPRVCGSAFVTSEAHLILDDEDSFQMGYARPAWSRISSSPKVWKVRAYVFGFFPSWLKMEFNGF